MLLVVDPQLHQALWAIRQMVKVHQINDGYIRSADVNMTGLAGDADSPPIR